MSDKHESIKISRSKHRLSTLNFIMICCSALTIIAFIVAFVDTQNRSHPKNFVEPLPEASQISEPWFGGLFFAMFVGTNTFCPALVIYGLYVVVRKAVRIPRD